MERVALPTAAVGDFAKASPDTFPQSRRPVKISVGLKRFLAPLHYGCKRNSFFVFVRCDFGTSYDLAVLFKEGNAMAKDLNLDNIQGNSLGGFNKDFTSNLFLKFKDGPSGRAWIQEISGEISSSSQVIQFNNQFRALKKQGVPKPEALISAIWVNLAVSFAGLQVLGVKASDLSQFPPTFQHGMAKAAVGDVGASAPANWIAPFNAPADVHAVLIVAADHGHELKKKVIEITGTPAFLAGVTVLRNQEGKTRSDRPGHEHFGFKDGVSQPAVRGVDRPDDPIGNPFQGHPGQDLLWPGEFVLGYETQIPHAKAGHDGPNPDPGPVSKSGPTWTADGSYLVFRRLRQDVAGFEKSVHDLAKALGWSQDLTGAKLVGRYKSGCPIEQRKFQAGPYTPPSTDPGDPNHGNPALANSNTLNNNFEFGDDPQGAICPMSAHIRKAYPRDEVTPVANPADSESATQTHRLLRRGIPYGEPFFPHVPGSDKVDRGLLFLAFQNDIANHFEFVQNAWVNNANFPPNPAGQPPLKGAPGEDPIIAQSPKGDMLIDPQRAPISVAHFVTTTGGEYFFSPSLSTIADLGSGKI
jgi:Dyp-type peroxidase family